MLGWFPSDDRQSKYQRFWFFDGNIFYSNHEFWEHTHSHSTEVGSSGDYLGGSGTRCPTGTDIFFEIAHQRGQWIHKVDVFCCQESLKSKWSAVSLSRNCIFKKITLTKICYERSTIFTSCLSLFGDTGTLQKAYCWMSGMFSGVKFNSKQLLLSSLYPKSA